jgi:hypothetical protein
MGLLGRAADWSPRYLEQLNMVHNDADALSDRGIACWLEARSDGQLRLVMDEVERSEPSNPVCSRTKVLFTYRDYDKAALLEKNLSGSLQLH